jgi:hypothetical protein
MFEPWIVPVRQPGLVLVLRCEGVECSLVLEHRHVELGELDLWLREKRVQRIVKRLPARVGLFRVGLQDRVVQRHGHVGEEQRVREDHVLDLEVDVVCPSEIDEVLDRGLFGVHLFADALRLWWLRDERAASVLLEALRATDPGRGLIDAEWALDLDVPQIEVAARVLARDAAALDQSLANAIELHRKYWSAGDRAGETGGWVSFGLAALMVLANSAGVHPTVTSDYVPPQLVGAHERIDHALILCPYCLVPITLGVTVCHACLEDPRNDAAIESDVAEFRRMARKRCPGCSMLVPGIAVRCASCRTRFWCSCRFAHGVRLKTCTMTRSASDGAPDSIGAWTSK